MRATFNMLSILQSIRAPRAQVMQLAALWITLFALAACWRLWGGVHYARLMVSFGATTESASAAKVIFCRTSTGELLELAPDDLWTTVWSRYKRFPAVRSIVVGWYETGTELEALPEVRAGLNWETSRPVSIQRLSAGPATETGLRSFSAVAEYRPAATAGSRLIPTSDIMNWQGDGSLIAIAAVQAIIGTLVVCLVFHVLQIGHATEVDSSALQQKFSLAAVPLEIVRLILLALFGHQFWVFLQRTVSLSSAESTLIGSLLVPIPWLLIFFWVRGLCTNTNPQRVIFRMVLLTIAVSMVKLVWLSGIEFRPVGDYEAFLRLGTLAAEGRWEEIGQDRSYVAFIYLRRAVFCVTPVVYCFGTGMWKLEVANVLVQAVSALLVCELVRRMFNLRAAACTLPFILLYPDFFYSSGMVSHNVWGYFWIPLAWLIYDEFQRRLDTDRSVKHAWLLQSALAACFAVAFGLSCTAIEFLKSYGVFMLAGIAIHLAAKPVLLRLLSTAPTQSNPAAGIRLLFCLLTVTVYTLCVGTLDRRLTELTGLQTPPQSTMQYFATMTASSFEEGHSVTVWGNDYASIAPPDKRVGVLMRQLLFEKIANARAFLGSLSGKNSLLAFGSDAMVLTQDSAAGDNRTRRMVNFSSGGGQHIFCEASVGLLTLLCLARLLHMHRIPPSDREFLPLLTTGAVLAVIYLLTEAHPYYSQNFAYPGSWSAGLVVSMINRQPARSRASFSDALFSLLNPGATAAAAAAIIGTSVMMYLLAGAWFDHSGFTFHRIREIQGSCRTNGPDFVEGEVSVSRTTASLTLRSREAIIPGGVRTTASFEVFSEGGPLRGLRFFVSGNQHCVGRSVGNDWAGIPVRYRVEIKGKLIRKGLISDLRKATFIELPAEFWAEQESVRSESERIDVSISLETAEEFRWLRSGPDPAVAVEYFN